MEAFDANEYEPDGEPGGDSPADLVRITES